MTKTIIKTEKLCKTFSSGGIQQHVLKNLDISLFDGDFTIIMGSSGSGKSTLLYAMSGMDKPTLGEIDFAGKNITKLNNDQLAIFRRNHCGFVFQQIYLLDNMSVLDNVLASGLLVNKNKRELAQKAKELLIQVGINDNAWSKFPTQLSGGEAQRVGIVRALINSPQILFADEPTGALNSASSESVLNVLTNVNQNGQSIVMVTHDMKTALRGNRILFLRDGVICGDLQLGRYSEQKNLERHEKLQHFLTEMRW
ncbi:ABC transporter ATP-binding protein [Solibacillus sp. CAU 1738]|uniref:ABC transporter ATP-binding protein n=1 Tax=Solibacillus sp. CAU 1738 TaxID=3140363 RepID=UPI003260A11D